MPTKEAIVSSVLPQQVEKPIPTRTVITRSSPRPQGNINQSPTSESGQAAASATTADSVKLSPQLTALARKQEAFRKREQALLEKERSLESRLAQADKYSQLETKLRSKDYSAAEELGLTYEEYTQYLLNKQTGEDPESQRFKALEEEIQTLKRGTEEKANKEYEETVAEYRRELTSLADTDPSFTKVKRFKESDEAGKEVSGIDIALQLIIDSWEEDGTEVTVDQALKDTELFLEERAKKWAALIDEPIKEEANRLPPPKLGSRTLTQQMQPVGTSPRPQKSLQHLSESERYDEARRRVMERRALQQGR